MQFPCTKCARTYEIADELVVGRAVKVACPACGNLAVHRIPAPEAKAAIPPPPPAPPEGGSALADASDDDFENAWASVEAPAGAEQPWPEPPPPAPAPAPAPSQAAAPVTPGKPATRAAAAPKPVRKPPPPPAPSLDEEEPVMVTAELVLRRSARRSKITAAVLALAVVAAVGGGGVVALKFKKDVVATKRGGARGGDGAAEGGAGAALSEADLAKLMGKKAEVAAPEAPRAAAAPKPAADRPKHEKLASGDKALLDLLGKKGDASVTVQSEDAVALATSRASLDEQAIEGTLSRNSGSFAACVSRAIAASPEQKLPVKRVNLELTVRPSGRVSKSAVAEKAIAGTPLGQCIAAAAKRMVFPGFDGEAIDIVVPLKLQVGF
jgi:hypothetical protein